jgi:hypothetical protein
MWTGLGRGHGHAHAPTDALRCSPGQTAQSHRQGPTRQGRAAPTGAVQPPWPNDEPRAGLVRNHGQGRRAAAVRLAWGSLFIRLRRPSMAEWPPFARARLPLRRQAGGFGDRRCMSFRNLQSRCGGLACPETVRPKIGKRKDPGAAEPSSHRIRKFPTAGDLPRSARGNASRGTRVCTNQGLQADNRPTQQVAGRGWASATWDDRSPELPIGHPCTVVGSGRINGLGRGRQGELAHAVVNRIGPAGNADWRLLRPRRGADCANRAGGLRPATPQLGVSMHNDREESCADAKRQRPNKQSWSSIALGVASTRRTGGGRQGRLRRVMHATSTFVNWSARLPNTVSPRCHTERCLVGLGRRARSLLTGKEPSSPASRVPLQGLAEGQKGSRTVHMRSCNTAPEVASQPKVWGHRRAASSQHLSAGIGAARHDVGLWRLGPPANMCWPACPTFFLCIKCCCIMTPSRQPAQNTPNKTAPSCTIQTNRVGGMQPPPSLLSPRSPIVSRKPGRSTSSPPHTQREYRAGLAVPDGFLNPNLTHGLTAMPCPQPPLHRAASTGSRQNQPLAPSFG